MDLPTISIPSNQIENDLFQDQLFASNKEFDEFERHCDLFPELVVDETLFEEFEKQANEYPELDLRE